MRRIRRRKYEKRIKRSALPLGSGRRARFCLGHFAMRDKTLAIDIGGTFTDVVLRDHASGALGVAKVLTRYPDPSVGVLAGVKEVLADVSPGSISRAVHGTTLVTNALIERAGAKTGLITTAGFRDALEIGREGRYDIYDLFLKLPEPLVERRLRLEVRERLYARGDVMVPLNEEDVVKACDVLREARVQAVAIVFLHAYVNPDHERRAAEIVRRELPEVAISVSHRVAAELREFERASTTVANAYVQPLVEKYLSRLARGLKALGIAAPLHIMLSNGGSCSVQTAAEFPVRLVESGPCGGALAAAHCGNRAGYQRVLAFDMGGTTAKAILTDKGAFPITTESEVARVYRFKRGSGLPLLVPVLDMIEIGAGGGSIAHASELGLPAVGPQSAGADPGPACYPRGGCAPTVTDADLLLGYLNAEYFLGGQMALDVDRAARAVDEFARSAGLDRMRAAQGICDFGEREYGQCRARPRRRARGRFEGIRTRRDRGRGARSRMRRCDALGDPSGDRAACRGRGVRVWLDARGHCLRLRAEFCVAHRGIGFRGRQRALRRDGNRGARADARCRGG